MIMLSIPIYNDLPTEFLMPLMSIVRKYGDMIQVRTYTRDGLISRVRNRMFSDFVLNPKATHLITIDDDCVFTLEQFDMLLEHIDGNKDIVVGAVPCKKDNPYLVLRTIKPEVKEGNLVELSQIGDFQLLSKTAAIKMTQHYPELRYTENGTGVERWAMFTPMLAKREDVTTDGLSSSMEYLDETWSYSARARDAGCRLWWDTRIVLGHKGTKVYTYKQ